MSKKWKAQLFSKLLSSFAETTVYFLQDVIAKAN